MKEFLFSPASAQVFFSLYHILVLLTLLVYIFSKAWSEWTFWLPAIITVAFLAEGLQFGMEVFTKRLKRPRLTGKALLIILMTLFWEMLLIAVFVMFADGEVSSAYVALVLGVLMLLGHDLNALIVFSLNPVTGIAKRRIFERARKKRRSMGDLITVGITGSYGKSSVKEFLYALLENKFKVLKTAKNENTEIGVAKTILQKLTSEHEVFVCEMGAYKKGEIAVTCSIAQPRIGVLTGINEQHLLLFGSQENIVEAKWELIESLPLNGLAVCNGDSELVAEKMERYHGKSVSCSLSSGDMVPTRIYVGRDKIQFELEGHALEAPLLGAFNILNLTMAISVARHLGVKWRDIQEVLKTIQPPEQTMVLQKITGGYIIDDSYNTNPDGMRAALAHMKLFQEMRKVVVFPGILELGKESERIHRELGEAIGGVGDELILTGKIHADRLEEGALAGGLTRNHIHRIFDQKKLFPLLERFRENDEIVVLFESRGGEKAMEVLKKQ
jgi:UDP-N-acetylmuramoyl-tripeptide--D-alanyl-D-alanine ligase